ncbi:MAG: response regulator [Chthoniobacterales bacterium]|nr:response regulator [Chthoniobacterales bacterium]
MASTTAQPSFASCRRDRTSAPRGQLLSLVAALTEPETRNAAAKALAAHIGADDLLVFVRDRELGILLPAPGFQQTLPDAKGWRLFLERCVENSFHQADLSFPIAGNTTHVSGFAAADGSVVVFLGGNHSIEKGVDVSLLVPILAAAFEGERIATVAEGKTAVAKQAATQAKLLADSLDKARNELRQTLGEAQRANAAKDRFLAVLSHELRTPLNPVLMAASAMETDPNIPLEIRADISMIRRNVELEAKLIDDLLDLTRISNGKVQLHRRIFDAHDVLEQAIAVVEGDSASLDLAVKVEFRASRHHVDGDPARIQQVFWNLIRNAVKFTRPDGSVTVRTSNPSLDTLCIEVVDTGIGIAAETLPKIFNAFEQGDTDINKTLGGLGLGLAISSALAELHGGTLQAESDGIGNGATFIFTLPAVEHAALKSQPVAAPSTDGDRRRILLVEDHATTAALMARLLRKRGHEVELAHTKADAIRIGLAQEFDMVISDLGLPDGNGYEVMEALRSKSQLFGIALSGYGMEADVNRSAVAGFQLHLTKPVDAQKLYQAVEEVRQT